MAALTRDRNTQIRAVGQIALLKLPVAASTKIYKGSLVAINSSGYAVPGSEAAGMKVVGIAKAQYDNSSGAAAAIWAEVYTSVLAKLGATSIAQGSVGVKMYLVDDQTVDETAGANSIVAGILWEYISATEGWILIDPRYSIA